MTYLRVIPRDLFNEADLLKCWGRLAIELDNRRGLSAAIEHDGSAFDIEQDLGTGAITVMNLSLVIRGERRAVFRPLNSREAWPLWVWAEEDDLRIFDPDGTLSAEFLIFAGADHVR